jgi:hypothetical protein
MRCDESAATRNHGNPRLVSAVLSGHKGFNVVAGEQTADWSTKTPVGSTNRGSGARHERWLSESKNGDTVDSEVARFDIGKELGQELGLDITDTTLNRPGEGVGDGIGDGLGVGSGAVGL